MRYLLIAIALALATGNVRAADPQWVVLTDNATRDLITLDADAVFVARPEKGETRIYIEKNLRSIRPLSYRDVGERDYGTISIEFKSGDAAKVYVADLGATKLRYVGDIEKPKAKAACICGDSCKCKPGDCPNKCPVDEYAKAFKAVKEGERIILHVGGEKPKRNTFLPEYWTPKLAGIAPGAYDCYLESGKQLMKPRQTATAFIQSGCPNGKCPNAR